MPPPTSLRSASSPDFVEGDGPRYEGQRGLFKTGLLGDRAKRAGYVAQRRPPPTLLRSPTSPDYVEGGVEERGPEGALPPAFRLPCSTWNMKQIDST